MSDTYEVLGTHTPNEGRAVINEAIAAITPAGLLQRTSIASDKTVLVPAEMQLLVYGSYRVDGTLDLEGELVVL